MSYYEVLLTRRYTVTETRTVTVQADSPDAAKKLALVEDEGCGSDEWEPPAPDYPDYEPVEVGDARLLTEKEEAEL